MNHLVIVDGGNAHAFEAAEAEEAAVLAVEDAINRSVLGGHQTEALAYVFDGKHLTTWAVTIEWTPAAYAAPSHNAVPAAEARELLTDWQASKDGAA